MADWLAVCREAVEDVQEALAGLPGRAEREPVVGAGLGGDETTAIDEAAERAIVARLERTGESLTLVSEELGERELGGGGPPWIVVDPIDGSLNAKRGIPHFSFSLAIAGGPTMGDVELGYVYDFGSGEEWTARRGEGAWLNGLPLGEERPKDEIEVLSFEATLTSSVAEKAAAMIGVAYRLRILGSLALALCQLAAGRIDGVCSLKPARSVDIAAAQLLVREVGLAIELFEAPPFEAAPLDVVARSRVVAAGNSGAVPKARLRPVRIGCSGWNYSHWRERFYPKGCPASRWLGYYAEHFDTVEVNATFYRLPTVKAVTGWVEQSPPGFCFAVKASRYLTHLKRLTDLDQGVKRFYERIEPLLDSPKLGPVLWQLPENFHRNDERLAGALEGVPPGRHCWEFRHPSWFDADVYALLREHGAALVIGDHPKRPFQAHELTADWTFIRFHYGSRGRGGNYSERELEEWAGRVERWARRADVYAYFNNDWNAYAIKNALWLKKRLGST